jgi:hypothetical protein
VGARAYEEYFYHNVDLWLDFRAFDQCCDRAIFTGVWPWALDCKNWQLKTTHTPIQQANFVYIVDLTCFDSQSRGSAVVFVFKGGVTDGTRAGQHPTVRTQRTASRHSPSPAQTSACAFFTCCIPSFCFQ